jgi:hypothetical protein
MDRAPHAARLAVSLLAAWACGLAAPAHAAEHSLLFTEPRVVPGAPAASAEAFVDAVRDEVSAIAAAAAARAAGFEVLGSPYAHCQGRECDLPWIRALVLHRDEGCVALFAVGRARRGPATLHPWVGEARIEAPLGIPQGDPLEAYVEVVDYAPCAEAAARLDDEREARVDLSVDAMSTAVRARRAGGRRVGDGA